MKNNNSMLAKRYSKALFEVALEQDKLTEVYQEVQSLQEIYQEVPSLSYWLEVNELDSDKQKELFDTLAQSFSKLLQNLLKILYKNRRLSLLSMIIDEFNKLYGTHIGVMQGAVKSVIPLTDEQKSNLEAEVAQLLNCQKVNLVNTCDESIIGGFIVDVNNNLVDCSLKTKLNAIKQKLLQK